MKASSAKSNVEAAASQKLGVRTPAIKVSFSRRVPSIKDSVQEALRPTSSRPKTPTPTSSPPAPPAPTTRAAMIEAFAKSANHQLDRETVPSKMDRKLKLIGRAQRTEWRVNVERLSKEDIYEAKREIRRRAREKRREKVTREASVQLKKHC